MELHVVGRKGSGAILASHLSPALTVCCAHHGCAGHVRYAGALYHASIPCCGMAFNVVMCALLQSGSSGRQRKWASGSNRLGKASRVEEGGGGYVAARGSLTSPLLGSYDAYASAFVDNEVDGDALDGLDQEVSAARPSAWRGVTLIQTRCLFCVAA